MPKPNPVYNPDYMICYVSYEL